MMRFARAAAQEVVGIVTSISLVILSSVECERCSLFFPSFSGERNCPRQANSTLRGFKKEDLLLGGLVSALGDFLADKCPIRPLASGILCGHTWVSLVKGALERGRTR